MRNKIIWSSVFVLLVCSLAYVYGLEDYQKVRIQTKIFPSTSESITKNYSIDTSKVALKSKTISRQTHPNLPAGKVEDIDFESYSTELASHIGLKQGEIRLDAIDKMRLYFAPEPGTNMVNLTSSTFERDDGSVMIFARNNLPDDSVFAEEVYAVFSGPGGVNKFDQTLATYGLRMKCRRGENAMEWTTELCS